MMDRKEYYKEYYLKNKTAILDRNKHYHLKHKDEIQTYHCEWYDANKSKLLASQKEYYLKNKKKISQRNREYRLKNKEKLKQYFVENSLKNKSKINAYSKMWYLKNKDLVAKKQKIHYLNNKKTIKEYNKKHYLARKEARNLYRQKYFQKRLLEDFIFKLKINFKGQFATFLRSKKISKNRIHFEQILGYNIFELKKHLERQFTKGMTWQNQGKYWQIDHIIPISWFKTEQQIIQKGYSLKNLQPLESKLNHEKKNYYAGNPKTNLGVIYL